MKKKKNKKIFGLILLDFYIFCAVLIGSIILSNLFFTIYNIFVSFFSTYILFYTLALSIIFITWILFLYISLTILNKHLPYLFLIIYSSIFFLIYVDLKISHEEIILFVITLLYVVGRATLYFQQKFDIMIDNYKRQIKNLVLILSLIFILFFVSNTIYDTTLSYFSPLSLKLNSCSNTSIDTSEIQIKCENKLGKVMTLTKVKCDIKNIGIKDVNGTVKFVLLNGSSIVTSFNNTIEFIIPTNTSSIYFNIYGNINNETICLSSSTSGIFLGYEKYLQYRESFVLYISAFLSFLLFLLFNIYKELKNAS